MNDSPRCAGYARPFGAVSPPLARRCLAVLAAVSSACSSSPHLDLGPTPAGVHVNAQVQYYDINAGSLLELRRALATEGPRGSEGRRWAAVTSWRMQWSYRFVTRGIACAIDRTTVRVTTVITFPRWNPSSEPDSVVSEWWYQYNAGLAEHERGHAQLAVKAASEIVRELDGMSGGACDALGTRAAARGRQINEAMQQQQRAYDIETVHGRTQIMKASRLTSP